MTKSRKQWLRSRAQRYNTWRRLRKGRAHVVLPQTRYPYWEQSPTDAIFWVQFDNDWTVEILSEIKFCERSHIGMWLEEEGLDEIILERCNGGEKVVIPGVGEFDMGINPEQWALENGILPFQPFKVGIHVRFFTHHGPEGDEGDCDTGCEILERELVPAAEVAEYWSRWLADYAALRERWIKDMIFSKEYIHTHPELLWVSVDWFWSDYYDDCSPPNAVRLTLHSAYEGVHANGSTARSVGTQLAWSESREGRMEEAWEKLRVEVRKLGPVFWNVEVRNLPQMFYQVQNRKVLVP